MTGVPLPLTLVFEDLTGSLTFSRLFHQYFLRPIIDLSLLVSLLLVVITASLREWCFLSCQQFSPPLSFYIQDVSFRKHEPIPPSDSCLLTGVE